MGPQRTHRTHPPDPEGQLQNSLLFRYWVFCISVMIQPDILMLNTHLRNCCLFYYILTEYCRVLYCWVSMVTHNGQAWIEVCVFVHIIWQPWDFSGEVQQGSCGSLTPGSHRRPLEEVRGQPFLQLLIVNLRILTLNIIFLTEVLRWNFYPSLFLFRNLFQSKGKVLFFIWLSLEWWLWQLKSSDWLSPDWCDGHPRPPFTETSAQTAAPTF